MRSIKNWLGRDSTLAILAIFLALSVFSYISTQKLDVIKEVHRRMQKFDEENALFVKAFPVVTLENLWDTYCKEIQAEGRAVDKSRGYITTSEGQSYVLLRAVWTDDKETFDKALAWTYKHLQVRDSDKLFAWKWGQDAQGNWGVLQDEGGMNTASDADQDIALALIFAYKRWGRNEYLDQAQEILSDIWKSEIVYINNRPYLVAGNWAPAEFAPTANPSYFSFAAYPIFAEVDPAHDWLMLKDTSYEVLYEATTSSLDRRKSAMLPPDWIALDRQTGTVATPFTGDKATDFSDDAFRVVWRVALDWKWHKDKRALNYLKKLNFLEEEWLAGQVIYSSYTHNGYPLTSDESYSMYAAILPYFSVLQPAIAQEIYLTKLATLYDPMARNFREDIGYYAQNWVWFGMAFQEDYLTNLYEY